MTIILPQRMLICTFETEIHKKERGSNRWGNKNLEGVAWISLQVNKIKLYLGNAK
jgi:hypothetical protein